jgi:hypothetical protein
MIIIVCTIISILCARQEEYLLDRFRSECLNKRNGKCVLTKCYIVVFKSTTFEERMGGKIIHV